MNIQPASSSSQRTSVSPFVFALVASLFFLSGSAGLVYQIIWMRTLGLFFGSDIYGIAIILGTFMGGLTLGGLAAGRAGEHVLRPLLWYGIVEIGIGVLALLVPMITQMFDPVLRVIYPQSFDAVSHTYQFVRIALASGAILLPTTLMGATLPLIMRHFVRSRSLLGERAAFFYGINTFGALLGTLVGGFILLPYLGMFTTTLCTAAINITIGICCIAVGRFSTPPELALTDMDTPHDQDLDTLPDMELSAREKLAYAAIIGIGISGIGSFALEVVWTRILLMSFSATVYSFTSMLACFLFGIFLGSILIAKVVDRSRNPLTLLAFLELGIGVSVALLCLFINSVPAFFSGVLTWSMRIFPGGEGGALVLATLTASFFLLIVPTTLLGATFSVALRTYTVNVARIGSRTGNIYAANTLGAIAGSLGAVLFLLPVFGAKTGLALIAILFGINGIYLLFVALRATGLSRSKQVSAFALAGAIGMVATTGLLMPYRITLNFGQDPGENTQLIYHREGVQSTIDILRSESGITSLVIGGNIEADDGYIQKRHFILKGHLPLMFLDDPGSVLVIGLGMGITLQATVRHDGIQLAHVVELSPEILEAHAYLQDLNGDVAHHPAVSIRIDDGRSYMKLSTRKYDMITADPIHPKVSRVGYLYTREYYEYLRERLNDGGIVCQWMPIYQMSPTRLRSAMKTFLDVFPNATFWYVKNHGLFVAKLDSPIIDYNLLSEKFSHKNIREDLASIDINTPEDFLGLLLMGPDEIREFVNAEDNIPVNTDDYPYLEYFVPGDLFYQPLANVRELSNYLVDPTKLVINQPEDSVSSVQAAMRDKAQRLASELEP